MTIVVILASIPSSSATKRRVLIDFSHGERIVDPVSGTKGSLCIDIFEDTYEIIESNNEITYKNIQDYDMLLLCQPKESFDSSEIGVITQFVSNGGGVLFLASHIPSSISETASSNFDLIPLNSLSDFFGIEFTYCNEFWVNNIIEIENQNHSILQNVRKVNSGRYGAIIVKEPSKGLLYIQQKCIVAYCEYGEGRAVFLANNEFILHPHVDVLDNQQIVINIFNWLTEPGGPHIHYKSSLDKGLALIEKGKEQMESGKFDLAKSTFTRSKSYLESALTNYESDRTRNLIKNVESLIISAETGIKAKSLYQEGKSLYEAGEYSSAVAKLEEAQTLFQSINSNKSEECAVLIEECEKKMNGKGNREQAEALLKEGITYVREEYYDLARAKFEEALILFTELQDEEKIQECEEWIASCEKPEKHKKPSSIYTGYIIGAVIVLSLVIGVILIRIRKKTSKNIQELEQEKKNLDEMLERGLVSQKEYDIATKEIERQLTDQENNY